VLSRPTDRPRVGDPQPLSLCCRLLCVAQRVGGRDAPAQGRFLRGGLRAIDPRTPIRRSRHRPGHKRDHGLSVQPQPRSLAAESPILRVCNPLRTQRVPLDITAQRQKMPVILTHKRLKPPLINLPAPDAAAVLQLPPNVRDRQPLHESRKLSVHPRDQHEVPVIRHDSIRQHYHRRVIQHVAEAAEKREVILLMPKQIHPPNAAIKDMVDQTTRRFASLSRHERDCKSSIDKDHGKLDLSRLFLRVFFSGCGLGLSALPRRKTTNHSRKTTLRRSECILCSITLHSQMGIRG